MNYKSLMQDRLPTEVYDLLKSIGEAGYEMNYPIFVVGGFVRDLLMGHPNLDIDVVVEGDGVAFARSYALESNSNVIAHDRFGTAIVTLPDGLKIDVATARTETYSYPGALPDVSPGSIKDDLRRRDFTINAMAIELNAGKFGELVDFFDGLSDIQSKYIRILHDLSFIDDPTRIFRAIRFEQRFSFSIEPHTKLLMEEAISGNSLKTITGQRIRNEILLILKEQKPLPSIYRMAEFNLTEFIHPAIRISHEMYELFHNIERFMNFLYNIKADRTLINLMALLDQLDAAEVEDVSKRLALTNMYAESLRLAKSELFMAMQRIGDTDRSSIIYKNLKQFRPEVLLFSIAKYEGTREKVIFYLTHLRAVKSWVNGNDLKKLGYPEGPLYTKILDAVFAAQLDSLIANKTEAIEFVIGRWEIGKGKK